MKKKEIKDILDSMHHDTLREARKFDRKNMDMDDFEAGYRIAIHQLAKKFEV